MCCWTMTLLCALHYVLYNLICYRKALQAENVQLYSAYAICHTQLCALGPPPIFCVMSHLQVCAFEVTMMHDRTLDQKTTVIRVMRFWGYTSSLPERMTCRVHEMCGMDCVTNQRPRLAATYTDITRHKPTHSLVCCQDRSDSLPFSGTSLRPIGHHPGVSQRSMSKQGKLSPCSGPPIVLLHLFPTTGLNSCCSKPDVANTTGLISRLLHLLLRFPPSRATQPLLSLSRLINEVIVLANYFPLCLHSLCYMPPTLVPASDLGGFWT
jgi:hypothetical protein